MFLLVPAAWTHYLDDECAVFINLAVKMLDDAS